MVESAPTDKMGFEPKKTKATVAAMKATRAAKAGTPASWDVASCSGMAIASNVTPARTCPAALARLTPRSSARGPCDVARSPIGVAAVVECCEDGVTRPP